MTTFVAWIGVDSRGISSMNFASDSRISWKTIGTPHWDMARKTFACRHTPDIFGYINDVLFPSIILAQLTNAIDNGLFNVNESFDHRFELVCKHIKNSHTLYPDTFKESFTIFHGGREGSEMNSEFKLSTLSWKKSSGEWAIEKLEMPNISSEISVNGSGKKVAEKWSERWNSSSQGNTSRAVFSSFCNALFSGEDTYSSAPPQIVALYRKGNALTIGFADNRRAYISGMEILDTAELSKDTHFQWRNRYFERCDASGQLLANAQRHHVPRGFERDCLTENKKIK